MPNGQIEPRRMYGQLPTFKKKSDNIKIPSYPTLKDIWEKKEQKVDKIVKPLIARWADNKTSASANKFAALTVIKDHRVHKEL